MASRDPGDLYPPLRERWEWMRDEWARRYGRAVPQPFLTATHRSLEDQAKEFQEGDSRARPGQSLHNFQPAYAFDIAFDHEPHDGVGNDANYLFKWYGLWGELAEEIGLEWGGRWPRLIDGPHVQIPMTWQQAEMGQIPELPPLPGVDDGWLVVLLYHGEVVTTVPIQEGDAIVTRVDPESRRQWIDVKGKE